MKKQIQIKINPDGTVEAKTLGITGKKCTEVIPLLEAILEVRTRSSEYTEDYYSSGKTADEVVLKNRNRW